MDGGDDIDNNCSAGINPWSGSLGKGFLLTAGHCVSPSSSVYGQGGTYVGPTLESWYTSGYNDALVRNDNAGFWWQGPWVDVNPADGGVITTRSYTDAPVGATVCKSGDDEVGVRVDHGQERHHHLHEPGHGLRPHASQRLRGEG